MNWLLIVATSIIIWTRFLVPTVGHSWPMVFIAFSHIFVGVMITLLWQARGKWLLGWICLTIPTALEAALFFLK